MLPDAVFSPKDSLQWQNFAFGEVLNGDFIFSCLFDGGFALSPDADTLLTSTPTADVPITRTVPALSTDAPLQRLLPPSSLRIPGCGSSGGAGFVRPLA